MRFITLTKINRDPQPVQASAPQVVDEFADSDDVGENQNAVAVSAEAQPPLTPDSQPTLIQVDAIRCLYARKNARPGTRITFTDGGGFAVTESYEEVVATVLAQA